MELRKDYIGYDYKTTIVSKKFESAWTDSYGSFGWRLERREPAMGHKSSDKVELYFKRDRKIEHKNELNLLEFTMENTMSSVEHMEKNKTFSASVAGYVTGLLGTVFMAISTFAYLASEIAVCVEFGIAGFCAWVLAFVAYALMKDKKAKKVAAEIERKFDEVNDICIRAYELAGG